MGSSPTSILSFKPTRHLFIKKLEEKKENPHRNGSMGSSPPSILSLLTKKLQNNLVKQKT